MNLSKLIDICVKVFPPRVTVVINLFGEVHLPVEGPKPAAMRTKMNYGSINVDGYDEYLKQERRRADDD